MKVGDIVTVYEDPITRMKPEGKARLVEKIRGVRLWFTPLERWKVRFLSDEDGEAFEREIWVE